MTVTSLVTDYFADVGAFHRKFDLTVAGGALSPHIPSQEILDFREKFMLEEVREFREACDAGDLEKAADALADLVYVACGTAHMMAVPLDLIWAEVQRANMAKEKSKGDDDPRSVRRSRLDVVKPAGWTPPDHKRALGL